MTPMGQKSEDKAFRIHANTYKNMYENTEREREYKHIQTQKDKLQQQHET